ncbi:MAG: FHA domain-containing protein, partial [Clostridia bacterium]|nr:FHA domain-containing protein [Clostridia bacterium]MBR2418166.1 FHA domain-containing protein [Clostridia bacterium]
MELVTEISRYFIPIVTLIILAKCMMTLWLGQPKEKTYGYIVDMYDGEMYELNMWETSIGRSNSCDVVISYDTVSRFQAVIARRNDSWYIHDLRSKSGIKVNGRKIEKKQTIKDGDVLTFGNMRFRFEIADDPVVRVGKKKKGKNKPQTKKAPPQTSTTKTSQGSTKADTAPKQTGYYSETNKPQLNLQKKAPSSYTLEAPSGTKIRRTAKPTVINKDTGEAYLLTGNQVIAGTAPRSHIRLKSSECSKKHAAFVLYEDGWAIEDLGSAKGTRLNGKKITSPQLLFDGDVISLADERLYYKKG